MAEVSKPGWRRFSFPLMYQTDVLEILLILTRLGREGEVTPAGAPILGDERMREALDLVVRHRDQGRAGRWVRLRALEVLQAAGSSD